MTAWEPSWAIGPTKAELPKLASTLKAGIEEDGVAVVPGFLSPEGLEDLQAEADMLAPLAYRSVRRPSGTVYLEAPDPSFPEGHPRRRLGTGASLGIVAYDQLTPGSSLRALYLWDELARLLAGALGVECVYPYADPLGAVNVTYMGSGDHLGWHFDQTDFVVSLALSGGESGGQLESAGRIRSATEERYEMVSSVLDGTDGGLVRRFDMQPGTLMLFQGRHSLHRVSEVAGDTVRCVVLLGFDTAPGTMSTERLQLSRYGRTA
jgi:hypothetical protein